MMPSSAYPEARSEELSSLLSALDRIAQSYYMFGRLEQALQVFQSAAQLLTLPEVAEQDRAWLLLRHGNMLAVKTLFENAPVEQTITMLEQAKQLATQLDDKQLGADALDGIGFAHYLAASNKREGDPHIFRPYFQEALERRRVLQDERGVSESLFHLGLTFQVLGQKDDARAFYTQALQIARQHGYASEASDALRHIGFLEQEQGNFMQARHYLSESLHLREHIGKHVYLPFAYVALADVCLEQGDVEFASSQCQKALHLSQEMNIKKALIYSLFSSGCISQKQQAEMQAREYFEQAYTVAQAIDLKYAMQKISLALQQL